MNKLTKTNELFRYSERVGASAELFLRLKDQYDDTLELVELANDICFEWQVDRLDMDEKVWELKRETNKA
jgi:hypothetical protein